MELAPPLTALRGSEPPGGSIQIKMKIYGTGKYPLMPKGAEYNEGEAMAKLLVEMGAATYEKEVEAAPVQKAQVSFIPKAKKK